VSNPEYPDSAPGAKFVADDGQEYYAAYSPGNDCTGCVFARVSCSHAPSGCSEHDTVWLSKHNYIVHRLKS